MKIALFFLAAINMSIALLAVPAQVVIIRHAEKYDTRETLSERGFQRAAALVPFFTQNPTFAQLESCAAVYASTAGKANTGKAKKGAAKNGSATRTIQTVSALANQWAVPFCVRYAASEIKLLAQEILTEHDYEKKMVLICWEHSHISQLAQYFGVANPPKWDSNVFDRVWIIDFVGNKVSSFKNLPQSLMYGDSAS